MSLAAAGHADAQDARTSDTLRLSLEEAVTTGLRVADEIRLTHAQSEIADAQFDLARASLLPQLGLTASYSRTFENARSNAINSVFGQPNFYNVNANLSQPIFQGGRLLYTARAASSLARAARLNAQEQRALLTVDVQRAYLGALLAERMMQLQESNIQQAGARLAQVEQFHTAGRAAQYDVLRARVERANIEPVLIQARNDRDLAHLELKRLLNLPLEQPLELTTVIDPGAAQTMVASSLDSAVVPDRPALRAAELVARSRRLAISAARSEFLPDVNFTFQSGFQAFPPAGFGFPLQRGAVDSARRQNGGWFEQRSMGIQFSWPLFDGLRAKNVLELARAQTRIAEVELRIERERVSVEVARARAELRRAKAAYDGRQQTSGEAQEAFRLASLRFSRGISTQLEVSDAQLALLTAEGAEARATYDLFLATAELARALGRPIPMPPTLRAPARRTDE
jgi:outer membrane protein TolC